MIVLPWPDKRLTANAKRRKHWRVYQPAIKADRAAGAALTLEAVPPMARQLVKVGNDTIPMTVTFYPPDARRRDDDGMISAFKHMRDGIADALGVDDHRFRATYGFQQPVKGGRVEVVLPVIHSSDRAAQPCRDASDAAKKSGPDASGNSTSGPDHKRIGAAS